MSQDAVSVPHLRIVRGTPTSEELAALVAVITAASSSAPSPKRNVRSRWASPNSNVRKSLPAGGWSHSLPIR
ncbi:MAG: acyl-CoA carboxylase subunit epsilon [Actinomycetes bacterium]